MSFDASKLGKIRPESRPGTGSTKASELEAQSLYGDKERLETLKQTLHRAVIWAVKVASFAMICLFVVRMLHLAVPECWMWLSQDRLQKVDSILFSGFLGAFVARYLNQAAPNGDASKPSGPR